MKLGTVALDGTKLHANASRHSALSYGHAEKIEAQLQVEVAELLARAEAADAEPLPEGLDIPEELARREARLKAIGEAKAEIEARAAARFACEQADYEAKVKAREEQCERTGQKLRGTPRAPPTPGPCAEDQINLTDPDSRILPAAGGGFEQSYNAQAAVDTDTMLVVATGLSQAANDKQQVTPMVDTLGSLPEALGEVSEPLARLREGVIRTRTSVVNRVRGLLVEYGIVVKQGVNALRRALPEILEDGSNGLSDRFHRLLAQGCEQLAELDAHIKVLTTEFQAAAKEDERVRRLQTIPGFGPIVAGVFAGALGDGGQCQNGRQTSAALGLVPWQHSSGGKERLLGISKRGDRYLRSLLVHGARAVGRMAQHKDDLLSRWINRVRATRGINKATVALANKLARIGWAMLRHNALYRPTYANARG